MARRSKTAPKVWRCGNFVIRRAETPTYGEEDWQLTEAEARAKVKRGEIGVVETYEVLSLDGAWCVRLMPGSQMETLLGSMLGEERDIDNEWVTLVCSNLFAASAIPNGHYHQGLMLLTAAYADPTLLSGGVLSRRRREFLREARRVRDAFLRWRRDYDEYIESLPHDDDRDLRKVEAEGVIGEDAPS